MKIFFSSRRRNTGFTSDWSSDVCSSDLVPNRETSVQITVNIAVGEIRIAYSDVTCGELKDMKRNKS